MTTRVFLKNPNEVGYFDMGSIIASSSQDFLHV